LMVCCHNEIIQSGVQSRVKVGGRSRAVSGGGKVGSLGGGLI
jgi:hypothetical protein